MQSDFKAVENDETESSFMTHACLALCVELAHSKANMDFEVAQLHDSMPLPQVLHAQRIIIKSLCRQ
jgi:hypothetical protein